MRWHINTFNRHTFFLFCFFLTHETEKKLNAEKVQLPHSKAEEALCGSLGCRL